MLQLVEQFLGPLKSTSVESKRLKQQLIVPFNGSCKLHIYSYCSSFRDVGLGLSPTSLVLEVQPMGFIWFPTFDSQHNNHQKSSPALLEVDNWIPTPIPSTANVYLEIWIDSMSKVPHRYTRIRPTKGTAVANAHKPNAFFNEAPFAGILYYTSNFWNHSLQFRIIKTTGNWRNMRGWGWNLLYISWDWGGREHE